MTPDQTGMRAAALLALNPAQKKRLAGYAWILASDLEETHDDVLQMAHLRWLTSSMPVVGPAETTNFLASAMQSIVFNLRRRKKLIRKVQGDRVVHMSLEEEDPITLVPDDAASQEDAVYAQQLFDLSATDEEVQALIIYRAEGAQRSAIMKEMGWDEQKYEAVCKRKLRMVAQWKIEGKVP
ncbi:MAG: hypothetical protein LCH56_06505 [Proteobacteria bacterium]|nr:hypothetical protein [Pseudomonadota bacterium]